MAPRLYSMLTMNSLRQTALLPTALISFSRYLLATRPQLRSVPFPGYAHHTDLDILFRNDQKLSHDTPLLTPEEITALRVLYEDLVRICTRAQERGVKIIIDAEYRYVVSSLIVF